MKSSTKALFFAFIVLSLAGCNKKGCSDPTADNYENRVKKARDKTCQYDGEGICGVGISFCMLVNGENREGNASISDDGTTTRVTWNNGLTGVAYEDLVIDFPSGSQGTLNIGNQGLNNTFQADFFNSANPLPVVATNGRIEITKNDAQNGVTATFNFNLPNGISITKGNLYRLK